MVEARARARVIRKLYLLSEAHQISSKVSALVTNSHVILHRQF